MNKEIEKAANNISAAKVSVADIRKTLYNMMYGEGSENLPDEVFDCLRKSYSLICEAKKYLNEL